MPLPKSLITVTPLSKALAIVLFVLLPFIGFYFGFLYANSLIVPAPLSETGTVPSLRDDVPVPTPSWQTYQDNSVSFNYPASWVQKSQTPTGSGFFVEFASPDEKFNLTFTVRGNYNQLTGKPFANIDDYVNMPYKLDTVIFDGQNGRRTLPRAGSENVNSVVFFSKDSQTIYTLELKSGDTPFNTHVEVVNQGQAIFTQILSTFKFTNSAN